MQAKVDAEAAAVAAEGRAKATRMEADAELYSLQRQADAAAYAQRQRAEADLYASLKGAEAAQREADADLIARQRQAEVRCLMMCLLTAHKCLTETSACMRSTGEPLVCCLLCQARKADESSHGRARECDVREVRALLRAAGKAHSGGLTSALPDAGTLTPQKPRA